MDAFEGQVARGGINVREPHDRAGGSKRDVDPVLPDPLRERREEVVDVRVEFARRTQRVGTPAQIRVVETQTPELHGIDQVGLLAVGNDELGRAAADVDDARDPVIERVAVHHAQVDEPRFLVAVENLQAQTDPRFDHRAKLFAVVGFADGRRRDRADPVCTARFGGFRKLGDRFDAAFHRFAGKVAAFQRIVAAEPDHLARLVDDT